MVNGQYQESSGTRYSDDVGIFRYTADGWEAPATYTRYNGGSYGPMDLNLLVRSTDIGVVGVLFGYQDDNNYYSFSMTQRGGYRRLAKKVNGVFTQLAASTQSFTVGQWMNLRIVMENDLIVVFIDGRQVMSAVDTSFSAGKIALWTGRNGPSQFDAVAVLAPPAQPVIGLTAPEEYAVSTGGTLNVAAGLTNTTNVGGVKFVLDEGTGGAQTATDPSYPYTAPFYFANPGTHEVRAYVLDGSSQPMSGDGSVDVKPGIGVNGYYLVGFGDSITDGVFDDDPTDDISLDGRNTSGGYEPVLNNLLTGYKPLTVVDEGHPGDTAPEGWARISTILTRTADAQAYLVMFGTNDTNASLNEPSGLHQYPGDADYPGSYKEAMQGIIDAIVDAGKKVFLAKIPPVIGNSTVNTTIQEFNQVIDELLTDPKNAGTGLVYAGPDFYTYFSNNPGQIGPDHVHPNGAGYAAMGSLWASKLNGNL